MRYKTTASVMRGMGGMMGASGGDPAAQQGQQAQPKKKKRFGLGDLIGGAIPIPQ